MTGAERREKSHQTKRATISDSIGSVRFLPLVEMTGSGFLGWKLANGVVFRLFVWFVLQLFPELHLHPNRFLGNDRKIETPAISHRNRVRGKKTGPLPLALDMLEPCSINVVCRYS